MREKWRKKEQKTQPAPRGERLAVSRLLPSTKPFASKILRPRRTQVASNGLRNVLEISQKQKKKDVFTHTPRNVGMRHWLRGPSAWRWLRRHAQPSLPPHEPLLSCSTQSSAAPAPTLATLGFPPAHASGNRQSNLPDCLHKTRITEKWKFRSCPGA